MDRTLDDDPSSVNPQPKVAVPTACHGSPRKASSQQGADNNDDDDSGSITISPQAVNTLFPSRVQQQPKHHIPTIRSSRESVLQRLSEALLRRCLTKVRLLEDLFFFSSFSLSSPQTRLFYFLYCAIID